jgi:hypothetical protein
MKYWNITIAEYNPTKDAVFEKTIARYKNYEPAEKHLNRISNKPVYLWHTDAVTLENPYFAIVETEAYKKEWSKIINH